MSRLRPARSTPLLLCLAGLLALAVPSARGQGGDLLVGDRATNTIQRFNATTGASLGAFAQGGGLDTPFGLAFGPDGNLYVSSLGTGTVLEYSGLTGSFLRTYITKNQGGLNFPNQLAFGPDGNLYVSSYNYNTSTPSAVLEYGGPNNGSAGTLLRTFTDPRLLGATGLAFGTTDGTLNTQLYVASSIDTGLVPHANIFRFDTSGTNSATTATLFSADPNLHATAGLSIDPNGNVVASNFDGNASSITRYNSSTGQNIDGGAFVTTVPVFGNINGPAVAIYGSDLKLYAGSYARGAIYRFNGTTGAYDSTFVAKGGALGAPLYMVFMPTNTFTPFGSVSVPEPGSIALLGLGLAGFLAYRLRTSRAIG